MFPVQIDKGTVRWRLRDLETMVGGLSGPGDPTLSQASSLVMDLEQPTIDRIAEAVVRKLDRPIAEPPSEIMPELLSVKDAASVLGIGRSKIYSLIREGKLAVRHIGKRTLITQASIRALL